MAKQPKGKFSTWKKKKPLERQVADKLVKTHERNEKLKRKEYKYIILRFILKLLL